MPRTARAAPLTGRTILVPSARVGRDVLADLLARKGATVFALLALGVLHQSVGPVAVPMVVALAAGAVLVRLASSR